MISVMSGASGGRRVLTRMVGMGSRGQVEDLMPESSSERSDVVMGEKRERQWSVGGGDAVSGMGVLAEEVASWLWMLSIFGIRVDDAGVVAGAGFVECGFVMVDMFFIGQGVYSESSFLV